MVTKRQVAAAINSSVFILISVRIRTDIGDHLDTKLMTDSNLSTF